MSPIIFLHLLITPKITYSSQMLMIIFTSVISQLSITLHLTKSWNGALIFHKFQFQNSSRTVPEQFQNSSRTVPKYINSRVTGCASWRFRMRGICCCLNPLWWRRHLKFLPQRPIPYPFHLGRPSAYSSWHICALFLCMYSVAQT